MGRICVGIDNALIAGAIMAAFLMSGALQAHAATQTPTLALLDVRFLNDNQGYEPTTDAERQRLAAMQKQFASAVSRSGKYEMKPVTDVVRAEIASGQPIGSCGGCEASYGKQLHVDRVAWMTVQKVSNLILNMNLYVADPATDKLTFLKSVDIRGNTDESWSRSLKYLLDNYFLAPNSKAAPETSG
jgi:hypothetical protein